MNKSESIANLAKALSLAQQMMGPALKDKANPFFKSHYADLSSVISAIREPLSTNGLSYVQLMAPTEGNEVSIETVLMHESGEWVSSVTVIPVSKADAQGYGSAITYAKRYGLQGMTGCPSEDDDGNAAAKAKPNHKSVAAETLDKRNPEQQEFLKNLALDVLALLPDEHAMFEAYERTKKTLDADEQVAWWAFFDSKSRAALKRAKDQEIAGQA
jgi:hypothetical protein